ncbi:hypothetical protein AN216_12945 [Streptomyces oceani]|uniref:Cobyrinic acid a,c-diamide synthase n=1 Tax=Streptomyces oceani TaxID=1075402 RepID=A0A1E7KGN6_9ACTN|nr:hypothetical protein [Streptomyces oceani]OEV03112.1 hypothetical protein AN216_12945 [Streptomyces oceani]
MSLPAADELFRTTGGPGVQPSAAQPAQQSGEDARVPAPAGEPEQERTTEHPTGEHSTAADGGGPADSRGEAAAPGAGTGEHQGRASTAREASPPESPQPVQRGTGADGDRTDSGTVGGVGRRTDAEQSGARRQLSRAAAQSAQSAGQQTGAQGQGKGRRQAEGSAGRRRNTNRRPSGRERHDEKITVYISAEELMDLEHARLVLRGEHGLAVDRGRIVREAVAVVLADLESRGDASILVRRLRGR